MENTSLASKRKREVLCWVVPTSVSRFNVREVVVGEEHLRHVETRDGEVVVGGEHLRLAFQGEGGGGGWRTSSVASKRETEGTLL